MTVFIIRIKFYTGFDIVTKMSLHKKIKLSADSSENEWKSVS